MYLNPQYLLLTGWAVSTDWRSYCHAVAPSKEAYLDVLTRHEMKWYGDHVE